MNECSRSAEEDVQIYGALLFSFKGGGVFFSVVSLVYAGGCVDRFCTRQALPRAVERCGGFFVRSPSALGYCRGLIETGVSVVKRGVRFARNLRVTSPEYFFLRLTFERADLLHILFALRLVGI